MFLFLSLTDAAKEIDSRIVNHIISLNIRARNIRCKEKQERHTLCAECYSHDSDDFPTVWSTFVIGNDECQRHVFLSFLPFSGGFERPSHSLLLPSTERYKAHTRVCTTHHDEHGTYGGMEAHNIWISHTVLTLLYASKHLYRFG